MGFPFIPAWLREVQAKSLNHSNEKAAGIIFLPAFNDCRRRDLLAFALHRELQEEREGPTEVSGRIRGMV